MVLIVLLSVMIVSIIGCKKKPVTDETLQPQVESTEDQTTTNADTVTDDVYGSNLNNDIGNAMDATTGIVVSDEALIENLTEFTERFFYNYLFNPTSEDGKLSESDMQLFAISYIYQYEYNELKFDTENFILYIPEKNVTDVIKRFFNYEFINHDYPADEAIDYKDGYYLVAARDGVFEDEAVVTKITKISDYNYKVVFEVQKKNAPINAPIEYYEAIIQSLDDRFVLVSYLKHVIELEVPQNEGFDEGTDVQ